MPGLEPETEEGIPILSAERIAELRANIPSEDLLDMVEECISDLFHRLPALRRRRQRLIGGHRELHNGPGGVAVQRGRDGRIRRNRRVRIRHYWRKTSLGKRFFLPGAQEDETLANMPTNLTRNVFRIAWAASTAA